MATKPTTLPRQWATLANYDNGPFIGQPMKVDPGVGIAASGHRPGAAFPTPAEYENYQQNKVTALWIPWVNAGSSAGAADAHIVEANSVGRSALVGLNLSDAVDETVLNVVGVNTLAPTVLVDSTAGGGTAFQAVIDPDSYGFSTNVGNGTGAGVSVSLTSTPSGGSGVSVTGDAASSGTGVLIDMAGDSHGISSTVAGDGHAGKFQNTVGSTFAALRVDGSTSAQTAADIRGNGGAQALFVQGISAVIAATFRGGTTAGTNGIESYTLNATGAAVVASPSLTATSAGRGFYCATPTTSAACAAEFVSGGSGANGNYAVILTGDTTSPSKGIVLMTPQNADPSGGGVSGGLAMSTAKGLTQGNFSDGTWRSVWHSLDGYTCAFTSASPPATISTIGGIGVWRVVGEITTSANGNFVKVAGATVLLRVSMTPRATTAAVANTHLGVKVEDTTGAPVLIFSRTGTGTGDASGYRIADGTNNFGQSIAFVLQVVVPATGTRSYTLSINTSSVTEIRIRDVTMDFVGTVD